MSEKLHRRKILFIFSTISLFAYFVARRVEKVEISEISAEGYKIEESVNQTGAKTELIQDIFYEVDENLTPVKQVYPEMVLSAEDTGECRTADLVYSSERICSAESFNVESDDWESGKPVAQIDPNRSIRLTNITVPSLISGSPVMDSEVRQIHKDTEGKYHWTLKPAGEMVSNEVVLDRSYPTDSHTKEILEEANSQKTEPFAIKYRVEVGGDAQGGGKSEFTVDEYYENNCGSDCRNDPNPTPEKYSKAAKVLAKSEQPPRYEEIVNSRSSDNSIENCQENSVFLPLEANTETASYACTPSLKEIVLSFKNWLENIFTPDECSDDDPDNDQNCISIADIVVIMESPWGTREDCYKEDGLCVNEYNDVRNSFVGIPGADSRGNVYILTPCEAKIEGIARVQALKCAWDVEYIASEVDFQSQDNIPREEYPDTMEYMDFHIYESESRSDPPLTM